MQFLNWVGEILSQKSNPVGVGRRKRFLKKIPVSREVEHAQLPRVLLNNFGSAVVPNMVVNTTLTQLSSPLVLASNRWLSATAVLAARASEKKTTCPRWCMRSATRMKSDACMRERQRETNLPPPSALEHPGSIDT